MVKIWMCSIMDDARNKSRMKFLWLISRIGYVSSYVFLVLAFLAALAFVLSTGISYIPFFIFLLALSLSMFITILAIGVEDDLGCIKQVSFADQIYTAGITSLTGLFISLLLVLSPLLFAISGIKSMLRNVIGLETTHKTIIIK